ncbi:hypothetical protein [Tanticharoenia sakaeratensis]|jgi:hypothetical protein|uniref:Uncharacterized protein n=1 Tax=Tanticharoenia sakaeratensis NBRC 103193 TaxID=1231623 RepID=A0A0D6MNH5_9PROT|nr:hypothetical protein [Tanticharoenia sakaeratensis]GAN54828.1 hypothetical protein Tasa_031_046 [Tanticharoenia sakaeratensis NBRC 103193]GBQ21434.1 hypothetical protein AA103193_1727 [Tanticharoenia sakaeratensis NBRC 103193]
MTDRQWLEERDAVDPADEDADAIERFNGIGDPDRSEVRGLIRSFVTGLVLPLCLVGALLIVAMWMLIAKFNLLAM